MRRKLRPGQQTGLILHERIIVIRVCSITDTAMCENINTLVLHQVVSLKQENVCILIDKNTNIVLAKASSNQTLFNFIEIGNI